MKILADALERVRFLRGRNDKIRALADALRTIADEDGPEALEVAARLAVGRALPIHDPRTRGGGWRLLSDGAVGLTGWGVTATGAAERETGDLAEEEATLERDDPRGGGVGGDDSVFRSRDRLNARSRRDGRKRGALRGVGHWRAWATAGRGPLPGVGHRSALATARRAESTRRPRAPRVGRGRDRLRRLDRRSALGLDGNGAGSTCRLRVCTAK